jgi:hypothetical protein
MIEINNVKEYLKNLYENYMLDSKGYLPKQYSTKCLGAMEAMLVVLGKLEPGVPFDFQPVPFHFKLFWFIPIILPSKEGYPQFILRLTEETISK